MPKMKKKFKQFDFKNIVVYRSNFMTTGIKKRGKKVKEEF